MKPQIVVVEGRHDEARLNQIYPHLQTISVGGSRVDKKVVSFLKSIQDTHQIILFLDPDYSGERIRTILSKALTNVSHAFIDRGQGISKNQKKIGIEHANNQDIINALNVSIIENKQNKQLIQSHHLYQLGLIGSKQSKELRLKVAKHFNLGFVNGKTFIKRLNWLNIDIKQLEKVINEN